MAKSKKLNTEKLAKRTLINFTTYSATPGGVIEGILGPCKHRFEEDEILVIIDALKSYQQRTQENLSTVKSEEILYVCDRRACPICSPECSYTQDISHAKHFERVYNFFIEKD